MNKKILIDILISGIKFFPLILICVSLGYFLRYFEDINKIKNICKTNKVYVYGLKIKDSEVDL